MYPCLSLEGWVQKIWLIVISQWQNHRCSHEARSWIYQKKVWYRLRRQYMRQKAWYGFSIQRWRSWLVYNRVEEECFGAPAAIPADEEHQDQQNVTWVTSSACLCWRLTVKTHISTCERGLVPIELRFRWRDRVQLVDNEKPGSIAQMKAGRSSSFKTTGKKYHGNCRHLVSWANHLRSMLRREALGNFIPELL